jgi:hypothetical protein
MLLSPICWAACDVSKFNVEEIRSKHVGFSAEPSEFTALDLLNAIPDRFCEFNTLYGYHKKAGPLYGTPLNDQFRELEAYIKPELLISKYVVLASEAKWDADSVNYLQYAYRGLLKKHPKEIIDEILLLPKGKVEVAINFLFDGPHPSQKILKGSGRDEICNINTAFCDILSRVEKKLLKNEHHH